MNRLLFKHFLSSRFVIGGLLLVFLTGLLGIYNGKRHLDRLEKNIEQTVLFQEEHIKRNLPHFHDDMGLLMYYLRFAYVNAASALNGLSIGQRDVNNSIQFINIRNLEAEQYDTDLYNPVNLLMGNLDLSFVLIYLFPLLIIAFTYSLRSEEKEGGTWPLLVIQSPNPNGILLRKLGVRALSVFALLFVLLAVAVPVLHIPLQTGLALVMLTVTLYLLFWLAMCYWVVSWKKESAVNAISLLTGWVLLNFLLPAVINNFLVAKYPVPEALATLIRQREGYHARWDTDKKATMEQFYAHYPQYRQYDNSGNPSSWLWYYAMQQAGDDDARKNAADMKQKLVERHQASRAIAQFIPTLQAQLSLNALAAADMDNQLRFLDSTGHFHEQLRLHFYPLIFESRDGNTENWQKFQPEYFRQNHLPSAAGIGLPLLLASTLFSLLAARKMTSTNNQ